MDVRLVVFSRNGTRRDFPLNKPVTVLGRREDCDFRIPLGSVSREHCRIEVNGETVQLRDLDSVNGTFVNNERITQSALSPGDIIRVGAVALTVQIDNEPADITPPATPVEPAPSEESASAESPDIASTEDASSEAAVTQSGEQVLDESDSLDDLDIPDNMLDSESGEDGDISDLLSESFFNDDDDDEV